MTRVSAVRQLPVPEPSDATRACVRASHRARCGWRSCSAAILGWLALTTFAPDATATTSVIVGSVSRAPALGERFDVDVTVDVGSDALGSYRFDFIFDPAVVVVVGVAAGNAQEFRTPPVTRSGAFATGSVPLLGAQGARSAPTGLVNVARLTLQAVGPPGATSALDVRVVDLSSASGARLASQVDASLVSLAFDPGIDPDGDGLTNQQEFNAGTFFDRADSDGDGLPDGFEVLGGLDPRDDGSLDPTQRPDADPDGDGFATAAEFARATLPLDFRSRPTDVEIAVAPGFQLLSFPLNVAPDESARDLLAFLNQSAGAGTVSRLHGYESVPPLLSVADAAGSSFALSDAEGVIADVERAGRVSVHAGVDCPRIDLAEGPNLVGFPCFTSGLTAFQLLLRLGGESEVTAVQRFDTGSGRYETATWAAGQPVGRDFPIAVGEGYLIHMLRPRPGFDPLS